MKKTKAIISLILAAISVFHMTSATFASAESSDVISELKFISSENDVSEFGYREFGFEDENGNIEKSEIFIDSVASPRMMRRAVSALPSKYDSRDYNVITEPKYQGFAQNCWTFSAMGAAEAYCLSQGITNDANPDFSEAHLTWFGRNTKAADVNDPNHGDGVTNQNAYFAGGNSKYVTAVLSKWSGVALEEDYSFDPNSTATMVPIDESHRYDTGSGVILKSCETLTTLSQVKNWITEYGAVEVSILYDDQYLYEGDEGTAYYCTTEENTVNHTILIVGWDDNFSVSNFNPDNMPAANGAFLCKNSWSTYWGNGGYFWVSYYSNNTVDFTGYTFDTADKYTNNYTYNGSIYNACYSNTKETMQNANVFKSKGYEELSAISTHTVQPNVTAKISVYTSLPSDYTRPDVGALAYASEEILIENSGYHTIELPDKIQLRPNELFSVIISYTADEQVYIPVEVNSDSTPYSSNAGESFVDTSGKGTLWKDAQARGINNVFIQAFTNCVHQYQTTVQQPSSCTQNGTAVNCCTQCGLTTDIFETPSAGHSYGEWTVTMKATKVNEGSRERTCQECGHSETEKIPMLASNGSKVVNVYGFMDILKEMFASIIERIFENIRNN